VLQLDMADAVSIDRALASAYALHGRIDVLVNNAGYGLLGSVEAANDREVRDIFAINLFAPLAIICHTLPMMRGQGRGHIVNISSIAGIAPAPGSGIYAGTTAALSAISCALAQELAPFGLWVTTVETGSLRTDFLSGRSVQRSGSTIDDYAATSGRAVDGFSAKTAGRPAIPTGSAGIWGNRCLGAAARSAARQRRAPARPCTARSLR
jgi:short-subunit dehydrogenase